MESVACLTRVLVDVEVHSGFLMTPYPFSALIAFTLIPVIDEKSHLIDEMFVINLTINKI